MTAFVGVSDEPGRGILPVVGLYEFWTEAAVPVRLHDSTFLGLDYRLADSPSLTTTFVYDDPQSIPPEAVATPFIRFRFEGVRNLVVEQDTEVGVDPPSWWGRVSGFEHRGTHDFDLQVYVLRALFSAEVVRVTLSAD